MIPLWAYTGAGPLGCPADPGAGTPIPVAQFFPICSFAPPRCAFSLAPPGHRSGNQANLRDIIMRIALAIPDLRVAGTQVNIGMGWQAPSPVLRAQPPTRFGN